MKLVEKAALAFAVVAIVMFCLMIYFGDKSPPNQTINHNNYAERK